jgi:hypothetical protein
MEMVPIGSNIKRQQSIMCVLGLKSFNFIIERIFLAQNFKNEIFYHFTTLSMLASKTEWC